MLIVNRQSGFTLTEMVITLAIVGVLLAAAIPSYRSWVNNTQIRTAAESVQNGLQLARAEAARRNTSVNFTLNGNSWSVDTKAVGVATDAFYTAVEAVQSKSGTEGTRNARITATSNLVTFNGMGRVTPAVNVIFTIDNPTGGVCATNTNSSGMRCLNVVVDPGGKIRMCDPALNGSGNPQGCA